MPSAQSRSFPGSEDAAEAPRNAGESRPGGHGGITPSCVIVRIAGACAAAERADVIGNGAIPPMRWQPAHLAAKIGATSFHPGVPAAAAPVDGNES